MAEITPLIWFLGKVPPKRNGNGRPFLSPLIFIARQNSAENKDGDDSDDSESCHQYYLKRCYFVHIILFLSCFPTCLVTALGVLAG